MGGYIIGIDFDGTVVTHEYPEVGRDIGAVPVLKRLVNSGNKLILFTMRSGRNGTLQDAVNWFKDNGIELYGVNTNPTQSEWTDSTKAHCDIYIDDAGLATPTKFDEETGREYVDWERVEEILDERFGAFDDEDFDFDDEKLKAAFKRIFGEDYKDKKINEQQKMGRNVVRINESQLRNLIKEAVLDELNKTKIMPSLYRSMFKNRIINAAHGRYGDVEKAVKEFYHQFKNKIDKEGFTLENLMEYAEEIEFGETGDYGNYPGMNRQGFADGWWGANRGKSLEEEKLPTRNRIKEIVAENVRKVLKEEYIQTDKDNIVPQEVAELFGFRPDYKGYEDGLEIWQYYPDYDPCSDEGFEKMMRLCRKLGIKRPCAYRVYPSKGIWITVRPNKKEADNVPAWKKRPKHTDRTEYIPFRSKDIKDRSKERINTKEKQGKW